MKTVTKLLVGAALSPVLVPLAIVTAPITVPWFILGKVFDATMPTPGPPRREPPEQKNNLPRFAGYGGRHSSWRYTG